MPLPSRPLLGAALLATTIAAALAAPLSLTVVKAEAGPDMATGMPVLSLVLDAASAKAFADFTGANVGRAITISVAGEVLTSPFVREPILGGELRITGSMTPADAERLAAAVRSAGTVEVEVAPP